MKILLGCNLLTHQNSMAYGSHMHMWYHLGRETDHKYFLNACRRMSIDNMRNQCAKIAIDNEFDYLFFYDDDVILPKDTLPKLLGHMSDEVQISAGLTYVRGYPFKPMAFRQGGDSFDHVSYDEIEEHEGDVMDVDAIGFSTALIDVRVLKTMAPPWFITGENFTEDVYFCIKAKEVDSDLKIVMDKSIQTQHIIDSYMVSHENHKEVKRFEEEVFGATPERPSDYTTEEIKGTFERLAGGGSPQSG